ncbi:hypothetical protein ABPG74_003993 [Tetrahymena malaccensis]
MGNCQNLSVGNDPIKAEKLKKNNSNNLMIKTYTWNRDSHGLFDYESKGIIKNQLKIPEPGLIVREKDEIKILTSQNYKGESADMKKLAFVDIRNNHYVVDSEFITNTETELKVKKSSQEEGIGDLCVWAVVKSLKTSKGQKGYELQVGDYLKLGRVRFRIKELQGLDNEKKQNKNFVFGSNLNILNMDEMEQKNENVEQKEQDDTSSNSPNTCRICLGDNDEPDNPFITPCKCDGTMKCIHIKCLQQWLKSRLHPKQTPYSISFVWKTFDCELCKQQFPNMVKVKGNVYDTVEIPRPSPPYVTMEILSKDKNICKGIHVITLSQKNQIRLGRGHDSDIRISDISVSRCHAILSYDQGIFTIEDNNSKFGTLALIKDPIQLNNQNNNIAIQIGRTVLSFILKKNWKIYQVAIPPQQMAQKQNQQNKMESSPEKVEKKGPKVKTIEAPGQKDEENVMNQKIDEGENHNSIQPASHHPPRFMSQQAESSNQNMNNQNNNLNVNNNHHHHSGSDNEQGNLQLNHQSSNQHQANNNFQLPEFKDPAEELEAFQRQKEKESEIQILQQQLDLIKQHKNINQQNLQNLLNNPHEEQKIDHEKSKLQNTIDQYTQKIKEIENKIKYLQNDRNDLKENNNQSNNLISERSDNQSYRKNGYQESMCPENNINFNGQKIQKGNLNNTEYNPNGESQQQTERNLRQN